MEDARDGDEVCLVVDERRAVFVQEEWLGDHRADERPDTVAEVHCLATRPKVLDTDRARAR